MKSEESLAAYKECVKLITDLKKSDVKDVRSFPCPTDEICKFLDDLMTILANKKKTGWDNAKKELSEPSFLDSVKALAEYEKLASSQITKIKAFAAQMDLDRLKYLGNKALLNMGTFIVNLVALMELDEAAKVADPTTAEII